MSSPKWRPFFLGLDVLTHLAEMKWQTFCKRYFQMNFVETSFVCHLQFDCNLFLYRWFQQWLGVEQAISHCLNANDWRISGSPGFNELTFEMPRGYLRFQRPFWITHLGPVNCYGTILVQRILKTNMSNFSVTSLRSADSLAPILIQLTILLSGSRNFQIKLQVDYLSLSLYIYIYILWTIIIQLFW